MDFVRIWFWGKILWFKKYCDNQIYKIVKKKKKNMFKKKYKLKNIAFLHFFESKK